MVFGILFHYNEEFHNEELEMHNPFLFDVKSLSVSGIIEKIPLFIK
jgi:hypothetical protein